MMFWNIILRYFGLDFILKKKFYFILLWLLIIVIYKICFKIRFYKKRFFLFDLDILLNGNDVFM